MAQDDKIDLCIIGAGPAGIAAAERAAARGARVVLVEAGELGGVSHNWGTLPAQALSAAAERAHQIRSARDLGIGAEEPRINFARVNARIRSAIEDASPTVSAEHLTAQGIEIVKARARLAGPSTVEADGRTIRARHILVATGSRPVVPVLPGLEEVPHYTPETIFEITRRPGHLIVVGGGATGLSLAQSHLRLGCQVTVVEMVEPLAGEDPELVEALLRRLRAEGLDLRQHTGVVAVSGEGEDIAIEIKTGPSEERITGTHLLFATGRRPDFAEIGFGVARVQMEGERPALRRFGRTSNPRIFVIGDAAGHAGTHGARHSALMAVDAIFGDAGGPDLVPSVVQTQPAIARVGMTEQQARVRYGAKFEIVRAGFLQTEAAHARGEPHGHVKLVLAPDGAVVGAGVVGPHATDLIPLFSLAIGRKLSLADLERLVVPCPSFAQIIPLLAAQRAQAKGSAGRPGVRALVKRLLP